MTFLAVMTADGGIPLLTRQTGEDMKAKLPFASVGSLNGVHMFSRLRGAELKQCVTPEEKIVWRVYRERLVLILISKNDGGNDYHIFNIMDNIFAAMLMVVGMDLILKQNETVKLQKALTACYPLIDHILCQSDEENFTFADLTCKTDCFLAPDTQALQEHLTRFLEIADSLYGCLLIKGKVVVASKEWWTLTIQEKFLICKYVNVLPKVLSREVVIFLPTSSPQTPNRLVALHLLRDVEVCVLCSNEPSLATLEEEAPNIWKSCFDDLKVVSNLHPRNFPASIELDKNILGLILLNTETKQAMCSVQPSDENTATESRTALVSEWCKRQSALRSLYKLSVGTYFKNIDPKIEKTITADDTSSSFDCGDCNFGDCEAKEYCIYTTLGKGYVVNSTSFQIFVVFDSNMPNYATRHITHETLKLLTESNYFPPQ
ncbi:protein fuzzy homolog [Uloborus diversus]|uniref:protein fuzzy homolog n=1 Tax=Uloborus diversus TaxID=327109 RepID=UPI00240A3226|nr:protein fuzzy homolog [Uloborus diversus]